MQQHGFDDLRKRLASARRGSRFGFQGLRAADAIAVEECLPLDFLIACDWGLDGPGWDSRLRFFSVERYLSKRTVWTHSALVDAYNGPLGEDLRAYFSQGDAPRIVIPYRSTEFLQKLAEETGGGVSIAANPLDLKTRLDDKVAFRREAERRGLKVPPGEILEVGALSDALIRRWGPQLIVTERIGSSGNQTHLVETPQDLGALRGRLAAKWGEDAPVIANRFLEGPAVGATAFIYNGRAWFSHPSVMATGLAGCAMHRFDYAGSDYSAYARLPEAARARIETATLAIGEWVQGLGYKGIFGVDFIVHEGESHALEMNPRLLGTTQLLTELERRAAPSPPSVFWHLAEFFGPEIGGEESAGSIAALQKARPAGFQLLLRNTLSRPVRVGRSMLPGVYSIMNGLPDFLRPGERISALENSDEILLTCSPPERGTVVEPRGVFFKIEGLGSIFDDQVERVTPRTVSLVNALIGQLQLSEAT